MLKRIEWSSDKDDNIVVIEMNNRNKKNELECRGRLMIGFSMLPMDIAELSKVGVGRNEPNNDPFLPEPAGRFSLTGSILGGFFVVTGKLLSFLLNLAIIVGAVVAIA